MAMPRTAKQRAVAKRLSVQTFGPGKAQIQEALEAHGGTPTSSWWTVPKSREEFDQRLTQEAPRMRLSSFGHTIGRLNIGD